MAPPEQVQAWHRREAEACERARQWSLAVLHLDRLIEAEPAQWQLRYRRANAYGELGQWEKTRADCAKAIELGAENEWGVWANLGLTALLAGDTEGYRKSCAELLERFERDATAFPAMAIALGCLLDPHPIADPARLGRLAEKGFVRLPGDYFGKSAIGLALYRAGQIEEAVRRLNEADNQGPYALHAFVPAMCHDRLGHPDEARQWLAKGVRLLDQSLRERATPAGLLPWEPIQIMQVLRREAEAMIGPVRSQS